MSDDDLWRPTSAGEDPAEGPRGDAEPSAEAPQGVPDETQPIVGGSTSPSPPPFTPPGPGYPSPSGPGAVPPPQNPYGQAYGRPDDPYGQASGQQPPYAGQPSLPPPNPYQASHEYATPQNPYGSPYQPAYAGGALPDHPSATTAMVLGIIGLVGIAFCGGITLVLSPFAWVVGAKAVREIDASPGRYAGRDRAQGGKIMGIIGTVLLALAIVAIIGVIVLLVAVSTSDPGPSLPSPTFTNG